MRIEETGLKDCVIIHPDVFGDNRGWFMESYSEKKFHDLGIHTHFIQDNHSFSAQKGTIRGLHFQTGDFVQSKLVRCTKGKLYDIAVDLRVGSPTYKKVFGIELSEENHLQLFVPQGFAHGFITLTENTEIQYKVDAYYSKDHDGGIRYDDPEINIDWSVFCDTDLILSAKDLNLKFLKEQTLDFKYKD